MSKTHLRVSEVATQLNVGPDAVRKYANKGLLACNYTVSGQRVFTQEQVNEFLGVKSEAKHVSAFYARSSNGSKTSIENQLTSLLSIVPDPEYQVRDTGSGLNDNRKGLQKLIKLASEGKITDIYFTQPDRLTRFGYRFLEQLFASYNVTLHPVSEDDNKSMEDELLQDFMSLIASFSGKFYRLRGYTQQQKLLDKAGETLEKRKDSH